MLLRNEFNKNLKTDAEGDVTISIRNNTLTDAKHHEEEPHFLEVKENEEKATRQFFFD